MENNKDCNRPGPKEKKNALSLKTKVREVSLERQTEARVLEVNSHRGFHPPPEGLQETNQGSDDLDPTLVTILKKKVWRLRDTEKHHSGLLARITKLEEHEANESTPVGLRIKSIQAKGKDKEALQTEFDKITREAETKLLKASIKDLYSETSIVSLKIDDYKSDLDETIVKWKSSFDTNSYVSAEKVNTLAQKAAEFVKSFYLSCAATAASKKLQSTISKEEKPKQKSSVMDTAFVPTETSIADMVRKEVERSIKPLVSSKKPQNKAKKVDQKKKPRNKSQTRESRPRSRPNQQKQRPRSSSERRVQLRSRSKNSQGRGPGPGK